MKLRNLAAFVLVLLSSACASLDRTPRPDARVFELQSYITTNRPLAESGAMKWSVYYTGLYERHIAAGTAPEIVQAINKLQWNAQQYEMSSISREEFEFKQRDLQAEIRAIAQHQQAQKRAEILSALQMLQVSQSSQPKPLTLTPLSPAGPLQAVAPLTMQPIQTGATAYWTGKQNQVQTVTYQSGWSCEYTFAGHTFWRTFVGTCPSSIQVQ